VLSAAVVGSAWVDGRAQFGNRRFPGRSLENSPEGEWALAECKLKVANGRLTWTIPLSGGSSVQLQADYSTTKDSLVYGIVTKIDYPKEIEAKMKEKLPDVDDTFSFRFRVDEGEMNVRDLKGKGFDQLKNAAGRYRSTPDRFSKDKDKLFSTDKGKEKEKGK
jgi:hypothetical protein